MPPQTIEELAKELTTSWLNGNREYVYTHVSKPTATVEQHIAVVSQITQNLCQADQEEARQFMSYLVNQV